MMRHLLGGDYHSPGGASEAAWSPVRASPASSAGQPCDAASEGSPATPAARLAEQMQQQQQQSPRDEAPGPSGDKPALCDRGVVRLPSHSAVSALQSADAEQVPEPVETLLHGAGRSAVASQTQPPGESKEDAPHGLAQPEGAPTVDTPAVVSASETALPADQPFVGSPPTVVREPVLLRRPAGEDDRATLQPLSAIPARLQSCAGLATPSAADSPGAWALVLSPSSELGTPTAGDLAQPGLAGYGASHKSFVSYRPAGSRPWLDCADGCRAWVPRMDS